VIRFGRYEVLRKLGAGGLADVFLARVAEGADPPRGLARDSQVALKMLRDPSQTPVLTRFLREGRLLQRLSHPALPRCYGVVQEPRPFLVLELLEGESLSERLRSWGALPLEEVRDLARDMLAVLVHLHDSGVVHRDVKAANIFFADDGRTLLLDLGLARDPSEPDDTSAGDVIGTYAYMPPEQIAGAGSDERADLYALGVTLFEALAGERPFKARGPAAYLRAHTQGELPDLRERVADERLVDLVEHLMARDPAERPPSARVALATLTGLQERGSGLMSPPLCGREGALGGVEGCLDGGGVLQLVGEPGLGLGRMARVAFRRAQARGFDARGVRFSQRARPEDAERAVLRALDLEGAQRMPPNVVLVAERLDRAPPRVLKLLASLGGALIGTTTRAQPLPGHRVQLRPLDRDETHTLIAGMLGTTRVPAGLAARLHRFSGGLPGALVATMRDFLDRGVLRPAGRELGAPRWVVAPTVRMSADSRLHQLFRPRLQGLDLEQRRVVELLAVAGRPLPEPVLGDLLELPVGGFTILRLEERHLLRREGGWIGLRQPALETLVRRGLDEHRLRGLHQRLAEAMEDRREPWAVDARAYHHAQSAPPREAGRELVSLGSQLQRRGQADRALGVLVQASFSPSLDPDSAARGALSRGLALLDLTRVTEASEALGAALRLAQDRRDAVLEAQARAGLARVHRHRGQPEACSALLREALALDPPAEIRCWILLEQGRDLSARSQGREAGRSFEAAIELALECGDRAAAAQAHGGVGELYLDAGRLGPALRHLGQERAWLVREGPPTRLASCLCRIAEVNLRLGQLDAAAEALREAQGVAGREGLAHLVARSGVVRAQLLVILGQPARAAQQLERALLAGSSQASVADRCAWLGARVEARLLAGDRSAASVAAGRLSLLAEPAGLQVQAAWSKGVYGLLRGDGEAVSQAVELLEARGARAPLARVLLLAGLMGDAEVLALAVEEARRGADLPLLLRCLHACGGEAERREAAALARCLVDNSSGARRELLVARPSLSWALGRPGPRG
jgi:tetratricopeptide (TPR) repeat protein